jgi:MFS family permease
LTGVPAGRGVDRFGTRRTTVAGLVAIAVGCASLALLPATLGVTGYVGALVVATAGYAMFQAANNTAVMAHVDSSQRGAVSGLLNLSRNLGLVTGASAMGAVFAMVAGSNDVATAGAAAIARGMHATFAVATMLVAGALVLALGGRPRASMATLVEGSRSS